MSLNDVGFALSTLGLLGWCVTFWLEFSERRKPDVDSGGAYALPKPPESSAANRLRESRYFPVTVICLVSWLAGLAIRLVS